MKEEQERLRKHQEQLRKELKLRVLELEEENRKQLAEATLAELELQEDLSELNISFHDTFSRLSATSHRAVIEQIHEWINISPIVAETNNQSTSEAPVASAPIGTLNTHTTVPPPQTVENQVITEAVMATTEVTGGLIVTASVPQALSSTLPVPTALQVAPPTSSPTVSVPSLIVPMTSSTTSSRIINTLNQAAPPATVRAIQFNSVSTCQPHTS